MKLLASIIAGTTVAQDLYCNQCSYRFDHQGTHIQTGGDERCLELKQGDNTFRQKCNMFVLPNEKLTCSTEFIADWLPNGIMEYTMKRGCKAVPKDTEEDKQECPMVGSVNGFYFRDCVALCKGDQCNADNHQSMYELMAVKDQYGKPRDANKCRSCCSRTNPETSLQCMNDPIDLENGDIKCPIYANAGCFNANFHREGTIRPDEQEYNKGCSSFLFEDDISGKPDYSARCITEAGMESCKQTCDGDSCNVGIVGEQHQCYTCSVTVDSALHPLGWGDVECVEGALDRHLESCGPGQDVCVTEMEIDWRPSGLQTVTVRRGCANSLDIEAPTGEVACNGAGTTSFRRRVCTKSCSDTKCNQDLEGIEDIFADNIVETCRSCQSGEVITDDQGVLHDCAEDEATSITCPKFMTTGCYSSRSQNVNDPENHPESLTSHGCSAFAQDIPVCTNFDTSGSIDSEGNISEGDDQSLRVCKETCPTNDCNDKVVDPPQDSTAKCYQCTQSFNERGEPVGIGNSGCYNVDDPSDINKNYLRQCPSGQDYCSVDVEVDWTLRGEQRMTITRGCQAEKPSNPHPSRGKFAVECRAGDMNNGFQFKDCRQTFDEGVLNDETDELMQSVGGNTVSQCHTCEANRLNPLQCDQKPIEETKRDCPVWARQGCFKSVSEHYEDNNKLVQETIRGCSTFNNEDKEHEIGCNGFRLDGRQWEVCKQTCADKDNCNDHANNEEIFPHPLECFICEETRDHQNRTIGFSDTGCFEQPDEKYLHVCNPQATVCSTMMEVDWTIFGSQTVTVRRGCAVAQSPGHVTCQEESLDNFAYKRCIEGSVGPGSNDNLRIAEAFSHPNKQPRCYVCSHNSLLGEDRYNCFADDHEHHQDELHARRCPIYANAGCFTADNKHVEEQFGMITEVHRGCSTFITETVACAHMDYLDDTDYAVCRQTCTSQGNYACNSQKYPEEEDTCECPSDEL